MKRTTEDALKDAAHCKIVDACLFDHDWGDILVWHGIGHCLEEAVGRGIRSYDETEIARVIRMDGFRASTRLN
jgi:hypothetical protein